MGSMVDFFFKNRDSIEVLFWCAGIALPFVTVGALIYARAQVAEAKKYSEIIAKQAQATLLLNLVEKWNSADVLIARNNFREKQSAISNEIFTLYKLKEGTECQEKIEERWEELLDKLYSEHLSGDYAIFTKLISFFETVGLLVRNNYISYLKI
jgi:hypothetical protein